MNTSHNQSLFICNIFISRMCLRMCLIPYCCQQNPSCMCTDGAAATSGLLPGSTAWIKVAPKCVSTHCAIDREMLASHEIWPGLNTVMNKTCHRGKLHEEKYHKTGLVLAQTVMHRIIWHCRETTTSLLNAADCLRLQLVQVLPPVSCPDEPNEGDKSREEQGERRKYSTALLKKNRTMTLRKPLRSSLTVVHHLKLHPQISNSLQLKHSVTPSLSDIWSGQFSIETNYVCLSSTVVSCLRLLLYQRKGFAVKHLNTFCMSSVSSAASSSRFSASSAKQESRPVACVCDLSTHHAYSMLKIA